MRAKDVKVGKTYAFQINGETGFIRITEDLQSMKNRISGKMNHMGFKGVHLKTNDPITVRSAGRITREIEYTEEPVKARKSVGRGQSRVFQPGMDGPVTYPALMS